MEINIKSVNDFIRFAKEAIDQENFGMSSAPSDQAGPRNIPREGAVLASLAAIHFFSFLCEKAGITDTKASFKEAFSHEATLLSAMESGTDFYEAICVLNRILQLSQENKRLRELQKFKQSLPSIETLRRSLTERFGEHINGVIDFLQRSLIFIRQPSFSSLDQIDGPNIPCGGSKEGMLKAGRIYSFLCKKSPNNGFGISYYRAMFSTALSVSCYESGNRLLLEFIFS